MRLVILGAVSSCLFACSSGPAQEEGGGDVGQAFLPDAGQPVGFDHDYFPFHSGSRWEFETRYENHGKSQTRLGKLGLEVTAWDPSGHVATVRQSRFYVGEPSEYRTFQLRKDAGRIQVSTGGGWQQLVNTVDAADSTVSFLLSGPVAKPGGLYGSVARSKQPGTISTGAGSFQTLLVEAEYQANRNDPYVYQDRASEHWAREVGLVHASSHYHDAEMGYPNILSVTQTVSLSGYRLLPPDASPVAAGTLAGAPTPPGPPVGFVAERASGTRVVLSWMDQSLDETGFEVERRAALGPFSACQATAADVQTATDGSVEEGLTYAYRVRAVNAAGASEFSPEVQVNLFGVPQPPQTPSAALNTGGLKHIHLQFWLRTADKVLSLRPGWKAGSRWQTLNETGAVKTGTVVEGRFIENLFFCYEAGAVTAHPQGAAVFCKSDWPSGVHVFKVQAVNSYGASFYSEEATVTVP